MLSWEASPFRNSTEESTPWLVRVAATNYRDCVCVCAHRGSGGVGMLKGRSGHKMEGTSPNHRPLAPHKGKKDCSDDLNLNSISPPAFLFFSCPASSFSASASHWMTKVEPTKIAHKAIRLIALIS